MDRQTSRAGVRVGRLRDTVRRHPFLADGLLAVVLAILSRSDPGVWNLPFIVVGAVGVVSMMMTSRFVEDPPHLRRRERAGDGVHTRSWSKWQDDLPGY